MDLITKLFHQFEVYALFPLKFQEVDISITNSTVFLLVVVFLTFFIFLLTLLGEKKVPGRLQAIGELFYSFIERTVHSNVGEKGREYISFIFSVFVFVLFCNLLGMLPHFFALTSHISFTFGFACLVLFIITIIGFVKNGLSFFRLFAPSGVPWLILLVTVPIEIVSYFIRTISLSVRLFANIMAGHIITFIVGWFVVSLKYFGGIPLFFLFFIEMLEFLVAVLQAYIFAVLVSLYLKDALYPVH